MTKNEYISLLDEALKSRGVAERQEILDDYRQHFQDGRAARRSDAEIIRQLGSPVEAASEYDAGAYPTPQPIFAWKPHRRVLITVFALLFALSLSAFIIALNRPSVPDFPFELGAPPTPDETWIDGLSDVIDGVMDEVHQGLSALDDVDWGGFVPDGINFGPEAVCKPLDYDQSFDGIDTVAVVASWNLGCSFKPSHDGSVRVVLSGMIPEAHDVAVTLEGGLLLIKYEDNLQIRLSVREHAFAVIYLPEGWEGIAEAQTLAGNVSADGGVTFGALKAGTVSGNIVAEGVSCGVLDVSSISGKVLLSAVMAGSLRANTVNGALTVRLPEKPREMTLSSVAGNIALHMDGSYQFNFTSLSGSLSNESQGHEGPGGFSFSTVSGNVLLLELR